MSVGWSSDREVRIASAEHTEAGRRLEPETTERESAGREPLLVLEGVSKRFVRGSQAIQAVAQVSLALAGGEVVLLLGPNGAGKSTLLRMIAGLIEPSEGEIRIDGREQRGSAGALRREIGWCSSDERSFYPRLSGRENLRLFAALHGLDRNTGDARIAAWAQRFGLERILDRTFQACSTGERQKLNVIRALLHEPRVLLLDEPARSLDAATRATLVRVIAEFAARRDRLVLLAGHDFEGLEELGQRVVVLDGGRELLSGKMSEIAAHLGEASWRVTFRSRDACSRALREYGGLHPGPKPEEALFPAVEGGLPSELVACAAAFASELERIERHAGPSLRELLIRVGRGERVGGPRARLVGSGGERASGARVTPAARKCAPTLRVLSAMTRRDRLVFMSHRFQAGLRAGLLLAWVLSIYFVSKLVDRSSPEVARLLSGDYFTYALLGMVFLRIMQVCLIQMASALREEQLQGTIEPLVATGEPSVVLLLGTLSWPLVSEGIGLAIVFGSGAWLLGADFSVANVPAMLVATAATVIAMVEWGVLSAAFVIAFKRGDPVALLVNLISIGLSGVYFPVELLPAWLRPLPRVLPLTWGLDAVRSAVLHGAGLESPEYRQALAGLFVLILILAPVALWSQSRAFAFARRSGSLAQT
jgi:ABC-type multidrug transport system ATPase subunit/ABC-type multidrug transport system permease subunit